MRDASLAIEKTASASSVTVGQEITYTIKVSNNGDEKANEVVMIENVPPGLCVTGLTAPSGDDTSYDNPTITWTIGDLDKGESKTFTFTAIAQVSGSITNTATVSGKDLASVSDSETVEVQPLADLAIYKYACNAQALVNDTLTYHVVVVNNGASTATGVTVNDTFSNATIQSLEPSQGSCPPPPYGSFASCNLGLILPGETAHIQVTAAPTIAGTVQNTATVSSDVADPNKNNNTAIENVIVNAASDIGVTKTATPAVTVIGGLVIYTITVTNHGPSPATTVTIQDTLPTGFVVDTDSILPPCTLAGNILTCTISQLGVGASETIDIIGNAITPGVLMNTVEVAEVFPPDPNSCNDSASAILFVGSVEGTDLSISKMHSPEPVLVCTPLTYTVTVTNNGPAVATGVTLIDQLPPNVDILSVYASQGECCYPWIGCCPPIKDCCPPASNCSSAGDQYCATETDCCKPKQVCQTVREVVCQLGSLAVGERATVEITVRPKAAGPLVNTAMVVANQNETVPVNNQVMNTTNVIGPVEQIDIMIDEMNALAANGTISQQDADILIAELSRAKWAYECGSIQDAQTALGCFIQRINYLVVQKVLPQDIGCSLSKTAEMMKKQLNCPCDK